MIIVNEREVMNMKYILTKARDDNFIEIVDYDLEQINALAFSEEIIIKPNFWFNMPHIEKYIEKPAEFCNIVTQIPLEIMIYDGYIE